VPDSNTEHSHKHLCRVCNRTFDCAGEDCGGFHFGVCPDHDKDRVSPDAPPPEKIGEGGPWSN
jgi:hypothetical protein